MSKGLFAEISKLVIAGRIGEAVELTRRLYPGLLERERELLFLLQCRQFVEMVNGTEQAEVGRARCLSPAQALRDKRDTLARCASRWKNIDVRISWLIYTL